MERVVKNRYILTTFGWFFNEMGREMSMDDIELERLERFARNIISSRLKMERVEGKHGEIYLAHGINVEGEIVGVWGSRGMAHDYEFPADSTPSGVRQALVNHASGVISEFVDRDIIDAREG